MKKAYETPTVDKIAFNYRDQVVAASAGEGTTTPSNPTFGQLTRENWGQNGCKLHALETISWGVCNYA